MPISRATHSAAEIAAAAILALLAIVLLCPNALADADPASDVLLGENVFYPYDPPVSRTLQAALNAETTAAHRAHFPIKVALIAQPFDLGAIPTFFGKPKQYAVFLDQEINFGSKVPLLVVMPSGYGTAGLPAAAKSVIASLPRPRGPSGNALAEAAVSAVRKITSAVVHPLAAGAARPSSQRGGNGTSLSLTILMAVCVTVAATIVALRRGGMTRRRRRRPSGLGRRH
ncbi:MAG TPA: hypothetical protein VKR21_03560 [Solirubrobacteraceae bacterium]|nr:hypothetical protein [Solirubrobacteraceae bacterium]